jgi:hypothetical protein
MIGFECTYLVFLQTVLKDVLNNQATSLTKSDLVPHAAKSLINILHDLGRGFGPAKLKKLLPDMTSIAVNNSLWNTTKEFMNHDCLVVFRNRIESLLNDVTTESIHGQVQSVTSNGLSNLDDLFWSSVLEAALNQEVAKAIDHQWISLCNDSLNYIVLLLSSANFELLLQEDGGLLIIIADDLINNILPVAIDSTIKKTTVVKRFSGWQIGLTLRGSSLVIC